jgi:hypothetical protein
MVMLTAIFALGCSAQPAAQSEPPLGSAIVSAEPVTSTTETQEPASGVLKPTTDSANVPSGSWGGEFKFESDPEWVLVVADFAPDTTGLKVELSFPLSADTPPTSSPVNFDPEGDAANLRFAIPFRRSGRQDTLTFDGRLQDDKIVGRVTHGGDQGIFELSPVADFAPDVYESRT